MSAAKWNTDNKQIARMYAIARPAAPAKTAIFLPAGRAYDLVTALREGTITPETYCILFESDPSVCRDLRKEMQRWEWREPPTIINAHVERTPLGPLLNGREVDYAFLDFCSSLDGRKANWLATELLPRTREGATVAMTLLRTYRRCSFLDAVKLAIAESPSFRTNAVRRLQAAEFGGAGDVTYKPSARPDNWHYRHVQDVMNGKVVAPIFRDATTNILAAALLAWRRKRVTVDTAYEYSMDATSPHGSAMTMLRMTHGVGPQVTMTRRLGDLAYHLLNDYFPQRNQLVYG